MIVQSQTENMTGVEKIGDAKSGIVIEEDVNLTVKVV